MGVYTSKMRCLYLPAQSGKTRKMEEEIKLFKELSVLFGNPNAVNIVISANNKLLVQQTTTRLKNDLCSSSDEDEEDEPNAVISGDIFSWTSGTKKTNISVRELAYEIDNTESVEMVIVCAHSKRLDYLGELIHLLGKSRTFRKSINFWIDEADRSIKLWSKVKFESILALPIVKKLTLVSATHDSIFNKFKRVQVIPYQHTFPECYRRLNHSKKIPCDFVCNDAHEYIEHVITKKIPSKNLVGKRFFTPGDFTCESHDKVADILGELGFAVIVLNGRRKELMIPDEDSIDLRPFFKTSNPDEIPPEFNQTLSRIYTERELSRFPFAITGFLCVERGITFQCGPEEGDHDGFLFDTAIVPPISDAAEAYQTMARVFGNVGHIPGYKPCMIWSTSANFEMIKHQEEVAVNIARIVNQYSLRDVGKEELTWAAKVNGCTCAECKKAESRASAADGDFEYEFKEFTTLDAANEYLAEIPHAQTWTPEVNEEGFIKSSIVKGREILIYDDVVKICTGKKTANFDPKKMVKDQTVQRRYVGYKDSDDPKSAVYFVRRLTRTKESVAEAPWLNGSKPTPGNPFD